MEGTELYWSGGLIVVLNKRQHMYFGIWGIYILLLTCCVLISGVYQLINTIDYNIKMGVIDFDRTDYAEYAIYMYSSFAAFLSVALIRILIGGVCASCLIITPPSKRIKTIAYLFCVLAFCTLLRGFLAGRIGIMTFADIPQAILFFRLAKQWKAYQLEVSEFTGIDNKKYFPFFQEFRKAKKSDCELH